MVRAGLEDEINIFDDNYNDIMGDQTSQDQQSISIDQQSISIDQQSISIDQQVEQSIIIPEKSGNKAEQRGYYLAEKSAQHEIQSTHVNEQSGRMAELSGNVAEQSENETEQSGNKVEHSGNMVEPGGNVAVQSGNVEEQDGNTTEQDENIVEQSGYKAEQSGNKAEQSGNMIELSGNIAKQSKNVAEQNGNKTTEQDEQDLNETEPGKNKIQNKNEKDVKHFEEILPPGPPSSSFSSSLYSTTSSYSIISSTVLGSSSSTNLIGTDTGLNQEEGTDRKEEKDKLEKVKEENEGLDELERDKVGIKDVDVEQFLEENAMRKQHLQEQCAKVTSGQITNKMAALVNSTNAQTHMFTLYPEKRIAWCRTPKIGTTTWSKIFLQLYKTDPMNTKSLHNTMKKIEKKLISRSGKTSVVLSLRSNQTRKYKSIIAARHPFDRLYSAFKDKILGRRIRMYGVNDMRKKPKFSDFIKKVVNFKGRFNRHWRPNWMICNPCVYEFDYILKMESFSTDSAAVLKQLGVGEVSEIDKMNTVANIKRNPLNYTQLLENVSSQDLGKLLDLYYLDFILFGYDIQEFLNLKHAKKEKEEREEKGKERIYVKSE
ncbi:carbohydrate sulfotransferase 12 isoform X2 [Eurytemora carolleeae]|uniref:carbohydrate sulfotransferase 12 isoform X2 n=1 Tax=Eurytemora carolleeae TaxID=1294199 RepID=UPI000C774D1F|nr:carbohydrate sulfotransferase 12 isoform X2 [Eurytemora carolleeae]|eukprot:XP_023343113.1 carbohydrate sulfotransferase 12-like isoform X2 [Eurytemora affinis]